MRIALINPNTSRALTERIVAMAHEAAPWAQVTGLTAASGQPFIADRAAFALAARAVEAMAAELSARHEAVLVAAFGDPGLAALRKRITMPAFGIGEESLRHAASVAQRFAVVTTTPGLAKAIDARVAALGLDGRYAGVILTGSPDPALVADEKALAAALERGVGRAIAEHGVDTVVIGGGPLGASAPDLSQRFGIAVINPVAAAMSRIGQALGVRHP